MLLLIHNPNAMRTNIFYILLFSSLLCLACQKNAVSDQDADKNNADNTTATTPAEKDYGFYANGAPSSLSAEEQEKVAAINSFAFTVADKRLSLENDSFVVSPTSLACLLGMISDGAAGESRAEVCRALGFDTDGQEKINEFFRNLIVLSTPEESSSEALEIANLVVADKRFGFLEQYKESVAGYFDGAFRSMDFAEKTQVTQFVNGWANEHTHGKIKKVVDEVSGILCLVNALYFKGAWSVPFDKINTVDQQFIAEDKSERRVKMMYQADFSTGNLRYCKADSFSMVNLKYGAQENARYSMSVLLPNTGHTVQDVLAGLNAEKWSVSLAALHNDFIKLGLPAFSVSSAIESNDLISILGKMGILRVFSPYDADFSNMTQAEGLYVSTIKHLANISVDENGSEAASVSYADMSYSDNFDGSVQEFVSFVCNRPFIYVITDTKTGAILFLGVYR